jgi:hypothetical protein
VKKQLAHKPIPPPKSILRRIDNDLDYNPKTGIITWINPRSSKIKPGDIAGTINNGYIHIGFSLGNGKSIKIAAHHIAWYKYYGVWPSKEIDHKRGNKTDNRITKLRLVKHIQNGHNIKTFITNTTGVGGIYWDKQMNKYRARIKVNGKSISLGLFNTLKAAKLVRRNAEKQYYGKFRYRHND